MRREFPYETSITCKKEGKIYVESQILRPITMSRDKYHQRFYPSSRAVAEQRLMALGAALNYKTLLKYDNVAVEVPSGEHAWQEFATHASYDDLAQAILQAQHLFDNLYALGMVGKRDNQVKPN
jgi:hypothetical protein